MEEFQRKWLASDEDAGKGYILLLEPLPDFKQKKDDIQNERKKTLKNFLAYFHPYKSNFANLFIVMLIVTILQAFLPFISKAVIDVGIQTQDIDFINVVLLANVSLIVCITLCNVVRDWIMQHITARVNITLISDYLIKLMNLPITFFESKMTGDILQRANDHERIRGFIMNNSINVIFSFITFLVFGIVLLIYNPVIFYIFFVGSALYVLWVLYQTKQL